MRRQRRAVCAGFTLIEIVVCVTIISIVVAVALPAMIDLRESDEVGALEPVRTLLLEARSESAVAGTTVEVVVVPGTGQYRVEQRTPGQSTPVVVEGFVPLHDARSGGEGDRFAVIFRPVGLGVGDTLSVGELSLIVEPATGKIRTERAGLGEGGR